MEVGPGPGSLTRSVLKHNPRRMLVVEKDHRFIPALETIQSAVPEGKMHIHRGDILKADVASLLTSLGVEAQPWEDESDTKIIGNLPFNIATALLIQWMKEIPERKGIFSLGRVPMILMFQKEVAMRITAKKGQKEYSRLSVMVQHQCKAKCLFDLDGSVFVPPPKVKATVVYIEPLTTPVASPNIYMLEYVLQRVFSQRRKQLRNSILTIHEDAMELLHLTNIDPELRADNVPIEDWCRLADAYETWPKRDRTREKAQLATEFNTHFESEPQNVSDPWTQELKKLYESKK